MHWCLSCCHSIQHHISSSGSDMIFFHLSGIDDVFVHMAKALIKLEDNKFLESDGGLVMHENLDSEQATVITADQPVRTSKTCCWFANMGQKIQCSFFIMNRGIEKCRLKPLSYICLLCSMRFSDFFQLGEYKKWPLKLSGWLQFNEVLCLFWWSRLFIHLIFIF